jgi:hypothetical protein
VNGADGLKGSDGLPGKAGGLDPYCMRMSSGTEGDCSFFEEMD